MAIGNLDVLIGGPSEVKILVIDYRLDPWDPKRSRVYDESEIQTVSDVIGLSVNIIRDHLEECRAQGLASISFMIPVDSK